MTSDALKRAAGEAAAARVADGMALGLGTGSTARFFLEALAGRLRRGELARVAGVPTSKQTEALARTLNIPLTTLDDHPQLDLTVDGADEVDPQLNLIKGLGGALLREKVVAAASARFLVIVDEGKLVRALGQRAPVPVEVLPFGWTATQRALAALGARCALRLDEAGQPVRSDQGNLLIDAHFGTLDDAGALAAALDAVPGALGHGLFLGMAHEALVGTTAGARVLTP